MRTHAEKALATASRQGTGTGAAPSYLKNTAKGGGVFVSSGTHLQDPPDRHGTPQPTEAWRSAMIRQRSMWATITFWALNAFLVMYDVLDKTWTAVQKL